MDNSVLKMKLADITIEQIYMPPELECVGCLFSDHCDGFEYAPYCLKNPSGKIPSGNMLYIHLLAADSDKEVVLACPLICEMGRGKIKAIRTRYLELCKGKTIDESVNIIDSRIREDFYI